MSYNQKTNLVKDKLLKNSVHPGNLSSHFFVIYYFQPTVRHYYFELETSTPLFEDIDVLNTFSQVGEFNYADTIDYEEGFRMTGTVTVVDEGNKGSTSAANFDTVCALMVPSEASSEIAQRLRTAGFGVDSMVLPYG